MDSKSLDQRIDNIVNEVGKISPLIVKRFYVGKTHPIEAALLYVNALASKDIIDRDILNPLMLYVYENMTGKKNLLEYIGKAYISMSHTDIESDINKVIDAVKRGKTILLLENDPQYMVIDTTAGMYRSITEPLNETSIRGSREGFVENLETNISIVRRKVKDKNLNIEFLKMGRRSQTDIAIIYISDIADAGIISELKTRISAIDVDYVASTGILEQYLDNHTYNIFPQYNGTERPDKIEAELMSGKIALMQDGTPFIITAPAILPEFFQTTEDYYQRTAVASSIRILRYIAAFIVITLGPFYLTLVKSNNEFIPIKFLVPIAQARQGIALSIFVEILTMEIIVEFLREGGLRLPTKIGQTLSVVGGIIIGDAAMKSKFVSPTTLFFVGIITISSFLISNYDMSLAVRFLRFPMLFLSYYLGIFGIALGWYLILSYLCSLSNFDVPYLAFKKSDMKDTFIRSPLFKMDKRPQAIPNTDPVRQTDFMKKSGGGSDDPEGQ